MIHLDTHVVAWLYEGDLDLFPVPVRRMLEEHELAVSPMVELELEHLHEIGRLAPNSATVLSELARTAGLAVAEIPFVSLVQRAKAHRWTRDPFDRLIVAHADLEQTRLLTKDTQVRRHYRRAVWPAR